MIGIIGDFILDVNTIVVAERVCPEAPCLIAEQQTQLIKARPGGAGLAAMYSKLHDIDHLLFAPINHKIGTWLAQIGVNVSESIPLTKNVITKNRLIDASLGYQILRLDNDKIVKYDTECQDIHTMIPRAFKTRPKAFLLADYGKFLFTDEKRTRNIIKSLKNNFPDIPVFVDSKMKVHPDQWRGIDYLKVNLLEAERLKNWLNYSNLQYESLFQIVDELALKGLIITKAEKGCTVITQEQEIKDFKPIKTNNKGLPSVSGCGDVFDVNVCNNIENGIMIAAMTAVQKASDYMYESPKDYFYELK